MHQLSLLASGDAGSGGGAIQLVILLLIPVGMYFLLIRPQRRRMKEQQAIQSSIEQGDEVITSSGIYGFISAVEDNYFWLEIDDDVQIRIAKAAVQNKVDTSRSDDEDIEDDDDADES
jgi:preprotein translocase subunit YajC